MEVVTGSSIIRALSSSGPTIGDGFVCKIDRQRLDRDGNREVEELCAIRRPGRAAESGLSIGDVRDSCAMVRPGVGRDKP